jgi:hypothetical protein
MVSPGGAPSSRRSAPLPATAAQSAPADGHQAGRVVAQPLFERSHSARLRIAQIPRVEVVDADAVQRVGVFQQRRQTPVRVNTIQFFRNAVMDDGGVE